MRKADPVQLIIFDCDGVLVDTESIGTRVVSETLLQWGLPPLGAKGWQPGEALSQALERIRKDHPILPNAESLLRARMHTAFQNTSITVPGMTKLIARLSIPWAIASNGPEEKMRLTLERAGYTKLERFSWSRVFSGSALGLLKPEPDLFLHVAQEMHTPLERCLVIEDSKAGLTAARRAGMKAVHFMNTARDLLKDRGQGTKAINSRERVAHDVAELEEIFAERGIIGPEQS